MTRKILTVLLIAAFPKVEVNLFGNGNAKTDPFHPPKLEDPIRVIEIVGALEEAVQRKDYQFSQKAISGLSTGRLGSKYGNPEIKEAIIDLYLSECGRVNEPPSRNNPWTADDEYGYLETLRTMAESTLSPRIYEIEMFGVYQDQYQTFRSPPSNLREDYLARVFPEKTLEIILSATIGRKHPDYLYRKYGDKVVGIFSIEDAFLTISKMCLTAPELLKQRKERVRGFIIEHVFHYSGKKREEFRDCKMRDYALDLYELWKDPAYLPDVEKISQNLPPSDGISDHFVSKYLAIRKQVEEKARRVIASLEKEEKK